MKKKQHFALAKIKTQINFAVMGSTIPLLLKPKFPILWHLLCLYSSVRVGPVPKSCCWFSHDVAHLYSYLATDDTDLHLYSRISLLSDI